VPLLKKNEGNMNNRVVPYDTSNRNANTTNGVARVLMGAFQTLREHAFSSFEFQPGFDQKL